MKNLVKWIALIVLCLVFYVAPTLISISICEGWLGWLAGGIILSVIYGVTVFYFCKIL